MFDIDKFASDFEEAVPDDSGWQKSIEFQLIQGKYHEAVHAAEASLAAYRASGDTLGQGAGLLALAKAHHAQGGHLEEVRRISLEAQSIFQSAGSAKGEALALHALARSHMDAEGGSATKVPLDKAEVLAKESLVKFGMIKCGRGEAAVFNTLAKIYWCMQRSDDALEYIDKSLALFKALEEQIGQAAALLTKSTLCTFSGKFDEVLQLSSDVVAICKQSSTPSSQQRAADALLAGSTAAFHTGRSEEGARLAEEALLICENLGGMRITVTALRSLATASYGSGHLEDAIRHVDRALKLADELPDIRLRASVYSEAAKIYRAKFRTGWKLPKHGDDVPWMKETIEKTLRLAEGALALYSEAGEEHFIAYAHLEVAEARGDNQEFARGARHAKIALEIFERIGGTSGQAASLMIGADLQAAQQDIDGALETAIKAQQLFGQCGFCGDGVAAAGRLIERYKSHKAKQDSFGVEIPSSPEGPPLGLLSSNIYHKFFQQAMRGPHVVGTLTLDVPSLGASARTSGFKVSDCPSYPRRVEELQSLRARRSQTHSGKQHLLLTNKCADTEQVPEQAGAARIKEKVGNDLLGGRHEECPEHVHAQMVELVSSQLIATSNLALRAHNIRRRPTFYGPEEWKDAVKWGYVHPGMRPPCGMKWCSVLGGWKLIAVSDDDDPSNRGA